MTVAGIERVIVEFGLSMFWIVVPTGMPIPVTVSPTNSPVVLVTPVTEFDAFVECAAEVGRGDGDRRPRWDTGPGNGLPGDQARRTADSGDGR